jgi:hypothetical protein
MRRFQRPGGEGAPPVFEIFFASFAVYFANFAVELFCNLLTGKFAQGTAKDAKVT